jgi:hypothetical protein
MPENGKVRKAVLRERGITPGMWDREAAGVQLNRSTTYRPWSVVKRSGSGDAAGTDALRTTPPAPSRERMMAAAQAHGVETLGPPPVSVA